MTDLYYLEKETSPMISRPEVRVALNLAYMNSKGEVIDKDIKSNLKEEHLYESVRYSKNITTSNSTKFLPTLNSLDIEGSVK
jgi:hypothetical protein